MPPPGTRAAEAKRRATLASAEHCKMSAKRICVLGGGVVGVATAYYLAREGHRVTVLERGSTAGQGTSFANGGQLSYSYVAPLADPSVLTKLPVWLLTR